jgi:hypothetical protein
LLAHSIATAVSLLKSIGVRACVHETQLYLWLGATLGELSFASRRQKRNCARPLPQRLRPEPQ